MERPRSIVQSSGTISVKIGGLWKRSQGLSRLTKPNYKHRVFILTDQALSYYSGTVDVSISVESVLSSGMCVCIACCAGLRNQRSFYDCVNKLLFGRFFFLLQTAGVFFSTTIHTQRVGQQKRRVLLDSIRAVEFVDQAAFKLAHTLQVQPPPL